MAHITLITGGARSGKSTFAEQLAKDYKQVAYIATCQCFDEEMTARIKDHQIRRPSHWDLIEEPLYIDKSLDMISGDALVLVECLGLWVSNWLLKNEEMDEKVFLNLMEQRVSLLLQVLNRHTRNAIIVTNEVGMGVVPPYRLGRIFRDVLGKVNQIIAKEADSVYLCAAGIPICFKKGGMLTHG